MKNKLIYVLIAVLPLAAVALWIRSSQSENGLVRRDPATRAVSAKREPKALLIPPVISPNRLYQNQIEETPITPEPTKAELPKKSETPPAAPAPVKTEPVPPPPPVKKIDLPAASEELSKPSEKEIDISIEPSTIRLTGKPGESQEVRVRVYNNGTKDMKVNTEVNDMTNDKGPDGVLKRVYVPAGASKTSLGKWILLNDREFVVPAHSMREVPFVVSPPADLAGGASGVIFFRGAGVEGPEASQSTGKPRTTLMIQPRLGVLVFFEADGTVKRSGHLVGEVQYVPPTANQPFRISYEFENDGNSDILVSGTFHILDKENALVAKDVLNPTRTFPGDRGRSETEWSGALDPGEYHVVVSLELGPDAQETIVREHDFTVS